MDLCEILLKQLDENMNTIRSAKTNTCKFGSLIMCIFFYFQEYFPSIGKVKWDTSKPVTLQINDLIKSLGDNFDSMMTEYFLGFKENMMERVRIPKQIIEKHKE